MYFTRAPKLNDLVIKFMNTIDCRRAMTTMTMYEISSGLYYYIIFHRTDDNTFNRVLLCGLRNKHNPDKYTVNIPSLLLWTPEKQACVLCRLYILVTCVIVAVRSKSVHFKRTAGQTIRNCCATLFVFFISCVNSRLLNVHACSLRDCECARCSVCVFVFAFRVNRRWRVPMALSLSL